MRLKKYYITICLLLFTYPAYSAPSISGVAGTLADGQSITISGSSFGIKSTATPVKWDNFEGGVDESSISEWTVFGNSANSTYEADNNRTGSGLAYLASITASGDTLVSNSRLSVAGQNATKIYATYWIRWNWGTASDGVQVKHGLRATTADGLPEYYSTVWYDDDPYVIYNDTDLYPGWSVMYPTDTWVQVEIQSSIGTVGNEDGTLEYWIGQESGALTKVVNESSIELTSTNENWEIFYLYNYIGNAAGAVQIYFDDVYFDNSWARVVIGDNVTYTNCTKREIQPPSAWATDSITISLNQGGYGNTDTVYLYVIDSNGDISDADGGTAGTQGYEITLGDVISPTFSSSAITTSGQTTTVTFSEAVTNVSVDVGDFNLDCSTAGDGVDLTYSAGSGTSQWTFQNENIIYSGDTCTLDFDGDANEAEDASDNDLADFTDQTVTNNSTATLTGTTNKATGGSGGSATGGSGGSITGS